jgi:hypothetical protein
MGRKEQRVRVSTGARGKDYDTADSVTRQRQAPTALGMIRPGEASSIGCLQRVGSCFVRSGLVRVMTSVSRLPGAGAGGFVVRRRGKWLWALGFGPSWAFVFGQEREWKGVESSVSGPRLAADAWMVWC